MISAINISMLFNIFLEAKAKKANKTEVKKADDKNNKAPNTADSNKNTKSNTAVSDQDLNKDEELNEESKDDAQSGQNAKMQEAYQALLILFQNQYEKINKMNSMSSSGDPKQPTPLATYNGQTMPFADLYLKIVQEFTHKISSISKGQKTIVIRAGMFAFDWKFNSLVFEKASIKILDSEDPYFKENFVNLIHINPKLSEFKIVGDTKKQALLQDLIGFYYFNLAFQAKNNMSIGYMMMVFGKDFIINGEKTKIYNQNKSGESKPGEDKALEITTKTIDLGDQQKEAISAFLELATLFEEYLISSKVDYTYIASFLTRFLMDLVMSNAGFIENDAVANSFKIESNS